MKVEAIFENNFFFNPILQGAMVVSNANDTDPRAEKYSVLCEAAFVAALISEC